MPKGYCIMNNKEFFENRENCKETVVRRSDIIKDFESKSPEAAQAEIGEMLEEVVSVMEFVKDRFTEINNKHQAISCMGSLGYVAGISFCGKPITFAGVGTSKALAEAFKVIMMGMMSREN